MKIETLKENAFDARDKYNEYKTAYKATKDPLYGDLKRVYHAIKGGKQVIDIFQAIKVGGVRAGNEPNLAIAKAKDKTVICRYDQDGTVKYCTRDDGRSDWKTLKADIALKSCLPVWKGANSWDSKRLSAPVPIIPPRLRPINLTDDYYILWEVDHWSPLPSRDPYLLKRLSRTLFVVCAAWDLTDIEMAVMAGAVK